MFIFYKKDFFKNFFLLSLYIGLEEKFCRFLLTQNYIQNRITVPINVPFSQFAYY